MFDIFESDIANQFLEAAGRRLLQRAAGKMVDGFIDGIQSPVSTYKGKIEKVWIDSNVQQNGQQGVLIHSKFEIHNSKNLKCGAAAYFYFRNGTPLKDSNNSYQTVDGQVCVVKDLVPPYETSVYNDFTLFIPYHELHLSEGKHDLKFFVRLYEQSTNSDLARSNEQHFHVKYLDNQPRGSIEKLWVDFDVTQSEKLGMRIHIKFQADNLQNVRCLALAYFYDENEDALKDTNGCYGSVGGQVCSSEDFTPGHKNSIYNDLTLFMPYDEFHLARGEYGLSFRIRLFDQAKQRDIVWSDRYSFFHGEEFTIGQDEPDDVLLKLQTIVSEQCGINLSEVDPETQFVSLLRTSFLGSTKLIKAIEKNFNIKIAHDAEAAQINNLWDAALYITYKRKIKENRRSGQVHRYYPNVIAGEDEKWYPAPGYEWINLERDLQVVWVPGQVHRHYPNVLAAQKEGAWHPAPGYKWIDVQKDLSVVWSPGLTHRAHPNVIADQKERSWLTAPGYKWVNPNVQGDLQVIWDPGQRHRDSPNVVASNDGNWQTAPGYRWLDSNAQNDFRVVWCPGQVHRDQPNLVSGQKEGEWQSSTTENNHTASSSQAEMLITVCPSCSQKLRAPSNRGVLTLSCSKCSHSWRWSPTENNRASSPAPSEKVITSCPTCSQKLRAPVDRGILTLSCPKCKHSWRWSLSDGHL